MQSPINVHLKYYNLVWFDFGFTSISYNSIVFSFAFVDELKDGKEGERGERGGGKVEWRRGGEKMRRRRGEERETFSQPEGPAIHDL